jgi:hypothetical protein
MSERVVHGDSLIWKLWWIVPLLWNERFSHKWPFYVQADHQRGFFANCGAFCSRRVLGPGVTARRPSEIRSIVTTICVPGGCNVHFHPVPVEKFTTVAAKRLWEMISCGKGEL